MFVNFEFFDLCIGLEQEGFSFLIRVKDLLPVVVEQVSLDEIKSMLDYA